MTITTTTEVTEGILSKVIDGILGMYQYQTVTAVPYFRYKNMAGEDSGTASFVRRVKDSAGDIANETTALTPTAFETAAVDVATARVGIAREFAVNSIEDNVWKRALWIEVAVADAARLIGEAIDEDATALFASASYSVTDSGNAIEIADLVDAFGSQRAIKARGPQVVHLHDLLLKQLQKAQAAATATPWATFFQPNADHTEYGGMFMGAPVMASSLNPTANTAANRLGCVFSQGQAAPEYCAFGYAVKRPPTTKFDELILYDTELSATIARYGVGAINPQFATKLVFDNG